MPLVCSGKELALCFCRFRHFFPGLRELSQSFLICFCLSLRGETETFCSIFAISIWRFHPEQTMMPRDSFLMHPWEPERIISNHFSYCDEM